jgi:hypothetical protein
LASSFVVSLFRCLVRTFGGRIRLNQFGAAERRDSSKESRRERSRLWSWISIQLVLNSINPYRSIVIQIERFDPDPDPHPIPDPIPNLNRFFKFLRHFFIFIFIFVRDIELNRCGVRFRFFHSARIRIRIRIRIGVGIRHWDDR